MRPSSKVGPAMAHLQKHYVMQNTGSFFADGDWFYALWYNNLYDIRITELFSLSSARNFACSAGELEIGSESWSHQPKADLAYVPSCL